VLGERGSGYHRTAPIAGYRRAALADPRILILDEATSSVDTRHRAVDPAGVREAAQGRTSFVIAHRLSTIRTRTYCCAG